MKVIVKGLMGSIRKTDKKDKQTGQVVGQYVSCTVIDLEDDFNTSYKMGIEDTMLLASCEKLRNKQVVATGVARKFKENMFFDLVSVDEDTASASSSK